ERPARDQQREEIDLFLLRHRGRRGKVARLGCVERRLRLRAGNARRGRILSDRGAYERRGAEAEGQGADARQDRDASGHGLRVARAEDEASKLRRRLSKNNDHRTEGSFRSVHDPTLAAISFARFVAGATSASPGYFSATMR